MGVYEHLVVDTCAILNLDNLAGMGDKLYTTELVVKELKSDMAQVRFAAIADRVSVLSADVYTKNLADAYYKAIGEFTKLSAADKSVLALTIYLERLYCDGGAHINFINSSNEPANAQKQKQEQETETEKERNDNVLPGFFNPRNGSDEGNDSWLTPDNVFSQASFAQTENDATPRVVCATTDYAMQNVMLHLNLHICSSEGMLIKQARSYLLYCVTCEHLNFDVTLTFCQKCSYSTLRRLAYTINDGNVKITSNFIRPIKKVDTSKFSSNRAIQKYGAIPNNEHMLASIKKNKKCKKPKFDEQDAFETHDINNRAFERGYHLKKTANYFIGSLKK